MRILMKKEDMPLHDEREEMREDGSDPVYRNIFRKTYDDLEHDFEFCLQTLFYYFSIVFLRKHFRGYVLVLVKESTESPKLIL